VTESLAATAFYLGLCAFVFGTVRAVRASVEHHRRDVLGLVAIALGIASFTIAVVIFLRSPKSVLPF